MSNRVLAMARPYNVEAVQAVEPFTLETPSGQESVEPGSWVVCREGVYYVYTDKKFNFDFEVIADLSTSFSINANDVEVPDAIGEAVESPVIPITTALRLVDSDDDGAIDVDVVEE